MSPGIIYVSYMHTQNNTRYNKSPLHWTVIIIVWNAGRIHIHAPSNCLKGLNDESVVHTTEGEDHAAVDEDEERIRNSYLVLGCKLFFLIARPETVAQCVHGCGTVVEELRSWRSKGGPPTITSASHPIVSEVESRCMRVGGVGRTTSLASVVTRCDGSENGPKKSENTWDYSQLSQLRMNYCSTIIYCCE